MQDITKSNVSTCKERGKTLSLAKVNKTLLNHLEYVLNELLTGEIQNNEFVSYSQMLCIRFS